MANDPNRPRVSDTSFATHSFDSRAIRLATSGAAKVTAGWVIDRIAVSTPARSMSSSVRATDQADAICESCFPAASAAMYGGGKT